MTEAAGAAPQPFDALRRASYLLVTTYRRTGEAVATPVWFGQDAATLYLYTDSDSGKVKRLRHTARVTVAPCSARGKATGATIEAQGRILTEASEIAAARTAVKRKYGLQFLAVDLFGRLQTMFARQKDDETTWIAIEPLP